MSISSATVAVFRLARNSFIRPSRSAARRLRYPSKLPLETASSRSIHNALIVGGAERCR
jgi:hypothetical protein